jgi:ketosteroid isomerase-like protein
MPARHKKVPFYQLVASLVDVSSLFKSAVDAFNGQQLDTLMALFDENVVLVTVKNQDSYVGQAAVRTYFAAQFVTNKPHFTPTGIHISINHGGTAATISGSADWADHDADDSLGANIDGTISYTFTFVSRGSGWLISILWGSADRLNHRP